VISLPGSAACCFRLDRWPCTKARGSEVFPRQQPDGDAGDTPGVAAPVALAGAIVPGVAKFIVMLSAQAGVFGVGTTAICGSMLVPTN
jgi:hypothetical protein